jgi:hypothetical protein
MSLNEIYELLQSATSRAQRQALLDVFVFDDSLPENMVKTARVNNSDLTTSFAATRIKMLSDHSNLGGDNIKAMFKKLDQAKKLVLENQKHKWQVWEQATQVNATRRATFVVNAVNSITSEPVFDDLAASRPLYHHAEASAAQPPFDDDVPPFAHLHADRDLAASRPLSHVVSSAP